MTLIAMFIAGRHFFKEFVKWLLSQLWLVKVRDITGFERRKIMKDFRKFKGGK